MCRRPLVTFRLSSELDRIIPRKVIERVEPEESDEARLASLAGTVQVVCEIFENGSVNDVRGERGLGLGLDEKAVEAVRKWKFAPGTFDGRPVAMETTVDLEFRRAETSSNWHLAGAEFHPPEGASRPEITSAPFLAGSHLSPQAEETVLRFPARRSFTATIYFEVDEQGVPRRFGVDTATLPGLGEEAIAFLRNWRFTPGLKNGAAVAVPCKFDFVWGAVRSGAPQVGASPQALLAVLVRKDFAKVRLVRPRLSVHRRRRERPSGLQLRQLPEGRYKSGT